MGWIEAICELAMGFRGLAGLAHRDTLDGEAKENTMTIYLYALSNDEARLCHKQESTTCVETADLIEWIWKREGFIVNRKVVN
jgi:hypothetical protein